MARALINVGFTKVFRVSRGMALSPYAIGITPIIIEVDIETPINDIPFPEEIEMNLSNGGTETIQVLEWIDTEDYSQHHTGEYKFTADYEDLPHYVWQRKPLVQITVKVGLPLTSSSYYLASDDNLIIE